MIDYRNKMVQFGHEEGKTDWKFMKFEDVEFVIERNEIVQIQTFIELDIDDLTHKCNEWFKENDVEIVKAYSSISYSEDFGSNVYGLTLEYK